MAKYPPHDLTGRTFGRLTVLSKAPKTGKNVYWLCRCRCKTEKAVRADHIMSGRIVACGCAREGPQEVHHNKGGGWGKTMNTKVPAPAPENAVSNYTNSNSVPFTPVERTFQRKLTREAFEKSVKAFRASGFTRTEAEEMAGMGAEISD